MGVFSGIESDLTNLSSIKQVDAIIVKYKIKYYKTFFFNITDS